MDSRSLQISLVDMAGSERVKRSEVSGQGFKEAVSINKSLSALLDVINALSKGKTDKSGVPYRAHPLTKVILVRSCRCLQSLPLTAVPSFTTTVLLCMNPSRACPQVMSDSLGGNAKTLMFVNISPASSNVEESRSALGYATRASTITNHVQKVFTTRVHPQCHVQCSRSKPRKMKHRLQYCTGCRPYRDLS